MSDLTTEEAARVTVMLAELHKSGYVDIEEHGALRLGGRIRHRGHQWDAAYTDGTGIVIALTEKPNSAWSQSWRTPDVELIALWDKDWVSGRLSQVAQYHVCVIEQEVTS